MALYSVRQGLVCFPLSTAGGRAAFLPTARLFGGETVKKTPSCFIPVTERFDKTITGHKQALGTPQHHQTLQAVTLHVAPGPVGELERTHGNTLL